MVIKAIFFDFDQTLVNSMPSSKYAFKELCRLTNIKSTRKLFKDYMNSRFKDTIKLFVEKSDVSEKKVKEIFIKSFVKKIPKIKFFGKSILSRLDDKKIAIITYNTKKVVIPVLKHFKVKYDLLITDDDIKSEAKHDAMLKALKKFKLKKSEVLYVGDHIIDVKESHKAGIKSVVVPTGFLKKAYIKKAHPGFFVSKIDKVVDLI